jgi:hypothetical protein
MTFEEIQSTIEGMLAVQQQLQTSQVGLTAELIEVKESIKEMREHGMQNDRRLTLLIGHSFEREEDYRGHFGKNN